MILKALRLQPTIFETLIRHATCHAAPSPALHTRPSAAVAVAASVVVEVHDAGAALLALVHPGVPTYFVAAFLETLLGLAFNGLIDGLFTAVWKHLREKRPHRTQDYIKIQVVCAFLFSQGWNFNAKSHNQDQLSEGFLGSLLPLNAICMAPSSAGG